MPDDLQKPSRELSDTKEVLLGYLDYYRAVIGRKVGGLTESQLRSRSLPSAWSPLELVKHLTYMERRWVRWGFQAENVPMPLGDEDAAGHWHVDDGESSTDVLFAFYAGDHLTRTIVENASLDDVAAIGGRFAQGDVRPTLVWTLAYVLQEYARHAGHLDVARELLDGAVGE